MGMTRKKTKDELWAEGLAILNLADEITQIQERGGTGCKHDRKLMVICPSCHFITCSKCTSMECHCDNDE